jgi:pimeloyl-ACP methyl ester carboxylesterase
MLFALLFLTTFDSTVVRIAAAPGEELSVTIQGDGPDVVLLPGLFGSAHSFRKVTKMLGESGYRSIVIDLLGMGSSARPKEGDYSLMAQAQRVGAVLDSLEISSATFIGHSLAASVAMRLAHTRSELVSSIVSIEGGPTEAAVTPGFRTLMRLAPAIRMSGAIRGLPALIRRELKSVSLDEEWITRELMGTYTRGFLTNQDATIDAFQGMARSEEPSSLSENLHLVSCPVVLLVSHHRHKSGPDQEEVDLMVRSLPSFSVDTVMNTGFFMQEENPRAVVDAVLQVAPIPN